MPYDAFISYSHAADQRLAAALQRGLERLGRAPYQPRALHIFRDDTSLEASPELWRQSRLPSRTRVVCCPVLSGICRLQMGRPRGRPLVGDEVHATHAACRNRGSIAWDTTRQDFAQSSTRAVPWALYGAFASEPRNVSLEWARDDAHLDLRNACFRSAIAEVAAPMHGIPRDQLESEDLHQQRRALRLARSHRGATDSSARLSRSGIRRAASAQ